MLVDWDELLGLLDISLELDSLMVADDVLGGKVMANVSLE
jgi:hypothetical protein